EVFAESRYTNGCPSSSLRPRTGKSARTASTSYPAESVAVAPAAVVVIAPAPSRGFPWGTFVQKRPKGLSDSGRLALARVTDVTVAFQLVGQLRTTGGGNLAFHEHVHVVGLDVVEHPAVVRDEHYPDVVIRLVVVDTLRN